MDTEPPYGSDIYDGPDSEWPLAQVGLVIGELLNPQPGGPRCWSVMARGRNRQAYIVYFHQESQKWCLSKFHWRKI